MEEKICSKCKMVSGTLPNFLFHRHHITYDPEAIEILCFRCHEMITKLNTMYMLLKGGGLSNGDRRSIYEEFKNGFFDQKLNPKIEKLFYKRTRKRRKNFSGKTLKRASKIWENMEKKKKKGGNGW